MRTSADAARHPVLRLLRRFPALLAAATLATACSHEPSPTEPSPPPGTASLPLERVTEHFVLRYGPSTEPLMDGYAEALEASWPRITADLGAAPSRIEGRFHPDQASYTAATGYVAGGSVEGPDRFHLVAVPFAPTNAVHEFAHNVTLHLSPAAGNNPVWLWEAVALYESGQFVPPSSVAWLSAGTFPTLAQLNDRSGPYSIYQVGYVLAEFVVRTWGTDGLRRLVLAGGDTSTALGLSTGDFEGAWPAFVLSRYF